MDNRPPHASLGGLNEADGRTALPPCLSDLEALMQVRLGSDAQHIGRGDAPGIIWDTQKLINGHTLIVGKSGTGKTYTLKKMITQIGQQAGGRLRVHVMDVHGDIELEGASTVKFSESTPYGFNPLIINPDPDFGGVRKRVQSFINALSRTGFRLGPKQEAALRNVLFDLYAANGFLENDARTWRIDPAAQNGRYGRKQPAMEDAVRFANAKLRGMFLGTSSKTVGALEKLYRRQIQFQNKLKHANKAINQEELDGIQADIDKLKKESMDLFQEHMDAMQTGRELDDLIKYDSKDVMKSVVDRLENLHNIGIFRPQRPPFDPRAPIWRYDIKALSVDEKKLFVAFLLEAIFHHATQRGPQKDVVEIVILDEAHLFSGDEPDNPVNVIAKEARKFGLGLFAASQSPVHFSDDFLSNVGTKIVLGIDQLFWDGTVRKLKIDQNALEWVIPHQRYIAQMTNIGESRNKPLWVQLDQRT